MNKFLTKPRAILLALIVGVISSPSAFAATDVVIENGDPAGVGFNDTTPVSPVGGNSGTTLGQQRLIAFQAAANIWGQTLTSVPTITVRASWPSDPTDPNFLQCTATTAVLGAAGANSIWLNFQNRPFANTWYGAALANAISVRDLDPASPEIKARFNPNIGTANCLASRHWYYGLDGNHGADVDLVTVLLHEFAHGLGFQTFTNTSTGAQVTGPSGPHPSIFDRFLLDNSTGKTWDTMTDAERVASATNTGHLVWTGAQVNASAPNVLGTPRLRVNSPIQIAGNYQVGTADFGAPLSSPGITAGVVQGLDAADGAGPTTTDGCSALTNPGAVSGKIAILDRGTCTFIVKVKNAQNAGAVGVIVADNVAGPLAGMTGTDSTITIPSVRITQSDGNTIKAQLGSGVNASLLLDSTSAAGTDSSGRPLLYAPNPWESGSSVSHWDTSAFPNQLMEPNISNDLSHSVTVPQDLTFSLLKDVGWVPGGGPLPPANDNFANAQAIAGCTGTVNGTSSGATKQTGEPTHDPGASVSGGSVWYTWQAPSSGSVTFTTAGSEFDTVLAIYTGTSVSGLTLIGNNDDVVSGNTSSSVTFTATAGVTYRIAVDGWGGESGNIKLNWDKAVCTQPTVQLSGSSFSISEGGGHVDIAVTRSDTTGAASVDFATSDTFPISQTCQTLNTGIASSRCDYATTIGTLQFAAGEASKTIVIPIVDDNISDGNESFTLTLSNPTGATLGTSTATVTITDNANTAGNPIDGNSFFVNQHYIDLLGRLPDQGGFNAWLGILSGCGTTVAQPCDRIEVSSAFFRSEEFQSRGYFVYRLYSTVGKIPLYEEFMPDFAKVSGFLSAQQLEANKVALANNFTTRSDFQAKYGAITAPTAYVDALLQTVGVSPSAQTRQSWIDGLTNSTLTRAQVFRAVAETTEVYNKYYNEAFVIMQYFGYLRRSADISYLQWIGTMNSSGGDYRTMINGFLNSAEYRQRFGP
ncbi:MAG: hypothetical protein QOJ64_1123 [Acidobacteriota bacterium]|nr:hypothetical protein [Acidobacteriota bacterium]